MFWLSSSIWFPDFSGCWLGYFACQCVPCCHLFQNTVSKKRKYCQVCFPSCGDVVPAFSEVKNRTKFRALSSVVFGLSCAKVRQHNGCKMGARSVCYIPICLYQESYALRHSEARKHFCDPPNNNMNINLLHMLQLLEVTHFEKLFFSCEISQGSQQKLSLPLSMIPFIF